MGGILQEEIDLGLGQITLTEKRMESFDFTLPFTFSRNTIVIYTPKPKQGAGLRSLLGVFSPQVWLSILATILGTSVFLEMLCAGSGNIKSRIVTRAAVLIGNLLNKGSSVRERSLPVLFVLTSWWILVVTVTSSFTGSLYSRLAIPFGPDYVDTIEDLLNVVQRKGYIINVRNETNDRQMFSFLPKRSERILKKSMKVNPTNPKSRECYNVQKCASIMADYTSGRSKQPDPNFHQAKDISIFEMEGAITPKGNRHRERINRLICRLWQHGLFEKVLLNRIWLTERKARAEEERQMTLGFEELYQVFLMLAVPLCLSVLLLIPELPWRRCTFKGSRTGDTTKENDIKDHELSLEFPC